MRLASSATYATRRLITAGDPKRSQVMNGAFVLLISC